MAKKRTTYKFTAPLSSVKGIFISTVIFVPQNIVDELPEGRTRVEGTFNGAPIALAIQYMKDGSRYFSVSAPLRKAAKIKAGDKVEVIFKLVDPDKLELPEELLAVLAQDEEGEKHWNNMSIGRQRSLVHYVNSVKNVDSRIKRSFELVEKAKTGVYASKKK